MGLPETFDFARNFAVMVRVHGPDPKGLKMRKHAFHQYNSGKTTVSASGMLLLDTLYDAGMAKRILRSNGKEGQGPALIVTVASVVESFLSPKQRDDISQGQCEMIPGAQIDVMLELGVERLAEINLNKRVSHWRTAQLIRLVDVPVSSLALQLLVESSSDSVEYGWEVDVPVSSLALQLLVESSSDSVEYGWEVDVPVSSLALQSLVESSSDSVEYGWEVGWSLASHDNGSQTFTEAIKTQTEGGKTSFMERHKHFAMGESGSPSHMSKTTTRIAVLGVFLHLKDLPDMAISPSSRRGEPILAVGSPFGVLSSVHFFNSLSVGSIANCYPARSSNFSLLMADIRCLPGMEGGPVFGERGHFVGILIRPLRQKSSGAEIQLVIPWEAIATACSDLLLKEPQNAEKGTHINKENLNAVGNVYSNESGGSLCYKDKHVNSYCPAQQLVEKAMASVYLITIDEGVWASGVLLNDQGLILTNAHLLEPWRFGKTTVNGGRNKTKSEALFLPPEEPAFPGHSNDDSYEKGQSLLPNTVKTLDSSAVDQTKGYKSSLSYRGHRKIRVRLDHVNPWIWCDARVVYICKGPLDVALLHLEHVPDQLCPIMVDLTCPILGSKAYVIGHGLFGPRCGFSPSVCSGVVAKIVKAKAPPYYQSLQGGDSQIPAMLETTAAVHPGGSGGAVINSKGHMVGLVTSNARHGGGTVIPHLNFSIPCALLEPIFEFARDMQDFALLQNLDQPNQQISSVWALMPPLSPKPRPPLPKLLDSLQQDIDEQGKGSKFAKFMAERNKVLRSSTLFGKVESILNEIFPSKL